MGIYADRLLLEQKQDQSFLQAINEVYFGRTPSINSLFNAYCDWREPFVARSKHWTMPRKNFYNEEHRIFEDMTCKQFGFNTFSYLVEDNNKINSYTYGAGIPVHATSKCIEIGKDGYRFKDEAKFNSIIRVFPALLFNPEYTSEENFAIFLHEVGHNFQTAANQTIFCLSAATNIFNLMLIFMQYGPLEVLIYAAESDNTIRGLVNKFDNILYRNQVASSIMVVVNNILYALRCGMDVYNLVANFKRYLLLPINMIYSFIYRIPEFLISVVSGRAAEGYYGERFADSFAASYGFGEELASALHKIGGSVTGEPTIDMLYNDIPVFSHVMRLAMIPGMLLLSILDVHPSEETRCASIIKDMRRDLNDPRLDPKLKKQLQKDVDDYEKAMHEYYEKAAKIENPRFVSALIQRCLYESGGNLKMKLSELPYMKIGGFGAETNKTAYSIINGKHDNPIAKTIIK